MKQPKSLKMKYNRHNAVMGESVILSSRNDDSSKHDAQTDPMITDDDDP